MQHLRLILLLALTIAPLTGCVIAPARPYPAAVWVPGHWGPYGGWVRGHYA
jgi:hypothetical protein